MRHLALFWSGSLLIAASVLPATVVFAQAGPMKAPAPAAQGSPAATASAPAVGLVDIAQVFRQHAGFKQQMEALKQNLADFERDAAQQRQQVQQLQSRQKSIAAGSPEYRQLDETIARSVSQLQVRQELKQKEIREREARAYFETYEQVQGEIARLADQYRLSLILRFDGQEIDEHNPASVMSGLNRQVLFQRNLDLTPFVVSAVNRSAASVSPATSPGRTYTTANKPVLSQPGRRQ